MDDDTMFMVLHNIGMLRGAELITKQQAGFLKDLLIEKDETLCNCVRSFAANPTMPRQDFWDELIFISDKNLTDEMQSFSKLPLHQQFMADESAAPISSPQGSALRKSKGKWKGDQENQAFNKLPLRQQFTATSAPASVSSPQSSALRKSKGQWKARQEKHEETQSFSKLPLHQQFTSDNAPGMVSSPQGAALRKSKQRWADANGNGTGSKLFSSQLDSEGESEEDSLSPAEARKVAELTARISSLEAAHVKEDSRLGTIQEAFDRDLRAKKEALYQKRMREKQAEKQAAEAEAEEVASEEEEEDFVIIDGAERKQAEEAEKAAVEEAEKEKAAVAQKAKKEKETAAKKAKKGKLKAAEAAQKEQEAANRREKEAAMATEKEKEAVAKAKQEKEAAAKKEKEAAAKKEKEAAAKAKKEKEAAAKKEKEAAAKKEKEAAAKDKDAPAPAPAPAPTSSTGGNDLSGAADLNEAVKMLLSKDADVSVKDALKVLKKAKPEWKKIKKGEVSKLLYDMRNA